ncbi:MAG: preprotein translocase subunit SecG [Gammaproteobacteria bacterium]|nr:preprotein translocase subunit SecG [Gammaproteobacteria bacterium]
MQTILLVVHILLAIGLIGLILLQQGQGATTGAAFGSGASTTVFGARGSGSFMTRATAILAILFLANSLFLSYRSGNTLQQQSLMERVQLAPAATEPPAASDLPPVADVPAPAASEVAAEAAVPPQATTDAVLPTPEPAATAGEVLPPAAP